MFMASVAVVIVVAMVVVVVLAVVLLLLWLSSQYKRSGVYAALLPTVPAFSMFMHA